MDIKHLTWIRDQNIIETAEFDQEVNTKQHVKSTQNT